SDYETARNLAAEILPETLSDLKKPVSDLKETIERYLNEQAKAQRISVTEITFTRRAIREESGLPNYRIKELFKELEELEYLEVEKSRRGGSFIYRLVSGKPLESIAGLLSTEQLKKKWVEVERNGHFHLSAATEAAFKQSGRVEVRRS